MTNFSFIQPIAVGALSYRMCIVLTVAIIRHIIIHMSASCCTVYVVSGIIRIGNAKVHSANTNPHEHIQSTVLE